GKPPSASAHESGAYGGQGHTPQGAAAHGVPCGRCAGLAVPGTPVRPGRLRYVFPRPERRYRPVSASLRRGRPPGRPGTPGNTLGRQGGKGGLAEGGPCQPRRRGPYPPVQAAGQGHAPA
ncbi:Response regulator ArlR, partial [Dysosmobacter welbionis]